MAGGVAYAVRTRCKRRSLFIQAEDGIRDVAVTGVQTCALPISLPEAELDRFMMKVLVGYPDASAEQGILARTVAGFEADRPATYGVTRVTDAAGLERLRAAAGSVRVEPQIAAYITAGGGGERGGGGPPLGARAVRSRGPVAAVGTRGDAPRGPGPGGGRVARRPARAPGGAESTPSGRPSGGAAGVFRGPPGRGDLSLAERRAPRRSVAAARGTSRPARRRAAAEMDRRSRARRSTRDGARQPGGARPCATSTGGPPAGAARSSPGSWRRSAASTCCWCSIWAGCSPPRSPEASRDSSTSCGRHSSWRMPRSSTTTTWA